MYFETINRDGRAMMSTTFISCLPDIKGIESMSKAGYKFRINGKMVSKRKLIEFINYNKTKKE